MATPPLTSARSTTKKRSRLVTWVLGFGIGSLALLFIIMVVMVFGKVTGEEFSPSDFKRRSFHYYELPVVGLQVWPIKHFDATGPLEFDLLTKKLIVLNPAPTPRWDLVRGQRVSQAENEGDAEILCSYLDQRDRTGNFSWHDWTNEHPKLAAILWPAIAQLADQELYVFVPDAFALAAAATDENTFGPALNQLLAQKYYDFGLTQQKLERHAAATELIEQAIKLWPEQKEAWQAALEVSQKNLPPETAKDSS